MGWTAAAFAAATVVSGAMSARSQKAAGRYERAIHEQNARIGELQAEDALARGEVEVARHRLDVRALIGEQRAAMGAQGIEINNEDDSAGAVQLSTRAQGEYDTLTIRNNAMREAWGYRVGAMNDVAQGRLAEFAAGNRARDTILTSGIQAGMIAYGGYNRARVPATTTTRASPMNSTYTGRTYGLA